MAEINEILDYKEATNEYMEYYAIAIRSSFELAKLEGEGTIEHAVEMTKFSLDYVTFLHSNFKRVPPPARTETFSSLVLESFEATEAGLTSLHNVFLEASQLTYAKASSDEAFGLSASTGYRQGLDLLQEGLSTLGEAIDESDRLTTELENRMTVLK